MKIVLGVVALLLLGFSFVADYKWKRWMAARREERDHPQGGSGPGSSGR